MYEYREEGIIKFKPDKTVNPIPLQIYIQTLSFTISIIGVKVACYSYFLFYLRKEEMLGEELW